MPARPGDPLSGRQGLERRAVVARGCRVLYVPTPKVASTRMLWLLARAEGDPDAFLPASVLGPTPALAVHDAVVHGLPSLGALDGRLRAEVLTSDRWLRLGLTRDPYARLCSAWQHSVLLQTPGRLPFPAPDLVVGEGGAADLGASFRAFVLFLDANWEAVLANRHFAPQVDFLCVDLVEYTELAPVDRLADALDRLAAHAPALRGLSAPANESLGIDHRRLYDDRTADVVRRRYAADFDVLGYDASPPSPPSGSAPPSLDPVGRRLLSAVHERNRRIDLLRKGLGPRWELVRRRHALRSAVGRWRARRR